MTTVLIVFSKELVLSAFLDGRLAFVFRFWFNIYLHVWSRKAVYICHLVASARNTENKSLLPETTEAV